MSENKLIVCDEKVHWFTSEVRCTVMLINCCMCLYCEGLQGPGQPVALPEHDVTYISV